MKQKTPGEDRKADHGKTDHGERVQKIELLWSGEDSAEWQVTIGTVVYKPRNPKKGKGHNLLCRELNMIIEAAQEDYLQAQQDGDAAAKAEAERIIDQASADRQRFGC
jgi:predicted GNAT family N-acyltransferase